MFPPRSPAYTELSRRRSSLRYDDVDGITKLLNELDQAFADGLLSEFEHLDLGSELGEMGISAGIEARDAAKKQGRSRVSRP